MLDCYWVGSLGFNVFGSQVGVSVLNQQKVLRGKQQQSMEAPRTCLEDMVPFTEANWGELPCESEGVYFCFGRGNYSTQVCT